MGKPKNHDEDQPRRITFAIGEDPLPRNTTFLDLLADGEQHKSTKRGQLGDRIGAALQEFYVTQTRVAERAHCAVNGTFTIEIKTSDGEDGTHMVAVDVKSKTARLPPGTFAVMTDEDGEQMSRPARPERDEPLTDYLNEKAKTTADPKVGAVSKT